MWIVMILLLFVISLFASFIPFIGSIALSLFTPALMAGILYCAREVDENRDIEAGYLFQVFQEKGKLNPMLTLGGMYLLAQFAIVILMVIIMFVAMGPIFFDAMQGKQVPAEDEAEADR